MYTGGKGLKPILYQCACCTGGQESVGCLRFWSDSVFIPIQGIPSRFSSKALKQSNLQTYFLFLYVMELDFSLVIRSLTFKYFTLWSIFLA